MTKPSKPQASATPLSKEEFLAQRINDFIGNRTIEKFVVGRLRNRDTRPFDGREGDETPVHVLSEALKLGAAFPRRADMLKVLRDRVMSFVNRYDQWDRLTENDVTEAYWLGSLIELRHPSDSVSLATACKLWLDAAAEVRSGADENDPVGRIAACAVDAATAYAIEPLRVQAWHKIALAHPIASGLAFRAMLEAGADYDLSKQTLDVITQHAREDGWPVDVGELRIQFVEHHHPQVETGNQSGSEAVIPPRENDPILNIAWLKFPGDSASPNSLRILHDVAPKMTGFIKVHDVSSGMLNLKEPVVTRVPDEISPIHAPTTKSEYEPYRVN